MDLKDVTLDIQKDLIIINNMNYFDALFKVLIKPHETLGDNNLYNSHNNFLLICFK